MPITLDTSADWICWDNTETARFESIRGASAMIETLAVAKRRNLTRRELAASAGVYTGTDVVWLIPAATVAQDFAAKPGDLVVDADEVPWTVLEFGLNKAKQTWRLTTRSLAIANQLADTITIEKAVTTYDDAGAPQRLTYQPLYADLACRVQPQAAEIVEERGIRGQQTKYTIFLSRQVPQLDVRACRVLFGDKYLDLVTHQMAEQIAELPRLEAILKV